MLRPAAQLGLGAASNAFGSDAQMLDAAARLYESSKGNMEQARAQVFLWLLVLAMHERTIPSDIIDRMARSAPSRPDQHRLVRRLRTRITERREASDRAQRGRT